MTPLAAREPLKILQIVDEPWDSGLTDYALSLSQGLERAGHQVTVAVQQGSRPQELALRLGLDAWPLESWRTLRRKIIQGKYHIVNAHTGKGHSTGCAATWATPARLIRTRGDARALRRTPFWQFLYHRTSKIIACSDAIRADYLKTLRLPSAKVVTIVPSAPRLPRPIPRSEGSLRVGIVARLDPVKGHRDFLRAAALVHRKHRDSQFVLVGKEENVTVKELKALAGDFGISSACSFLGWRQDVSQIMQECDIGVVASIGSEAVSRAALEWMGTGRPLVATAVGCLPELVVDGLTGVLVPPGEPQRIAASLIQLAEDTGLRTRMGQAAWERARSTFSREQQVSKTLQVYRDALVHC